jgi:hypothetical protein
VSVVTLGGRLAVVPNAGADGRGGAERPDRSLQARLTTPSTCSEQEPNDQYGNTPATTHAPFTADKTETINAAVAAKSEKVRFAI